MQQKIRVERVKLFETLPAAEATADRIGDARACPLVGTEHETVGWTALFWEDGPWGITPPGHMVYIAMQLLQDRGLSFIELARVFALVGMTQCDVSICAWDSKYHHDVIRPESAIRVRAPAFGNPDPRVVRQADWQSYIPTPEFPAYPAGHSAFGAAAAKLLALILGRDDVAFSGRAPDEVLWAPAPGCHPALDESKPHGGGKRHEPPLWRRPLGTRGRAPRRGVGAGATIGSCG